MRKRKYRYFVADFETTVYKGQTNTEVWASAIVELFTENVSIFTSIDDTFKYLIGLNENLIVYYHNLKFDGSFWLSYFLVDLKLNQSFERDNCDRQDIRFVEDSDMPNKTIKYNISDKGMWYTIKIKWNDKIIELRDSLKMLPFSVKRIGESFNTKYKKLDMEYVGYRYSGCNITDEEKEYISNDVMVVKEALEIMYEEGHKKLTIGSCCLTEFKKGYDKYDYQYFFPDVYGIPLNKKVFKYENAGEWLRKSYKGGWCYLVKGKENQLKYNGTTADVNSLYPSMMSSESGNYYPAGSPNFWFGNYIPDEALMDKRYFFVRIKTRFYLKENMLPFIQIKGNPLYDGTEALETSDIYDKKTGEYYTHYEKDGETFDTRVELTLTQTDYKLFIEHYELVDFEILDGCWFFAEIGLFDNYIEKYKKIKLESKGARRELAKLFLNNLYGKMASSQDSSFKVAFVKEDGVIGFYSVFAKEKQAGYIPIGSAITSYARNFTIRTAQMNFNGKGNRGFIYADTDSIHCDLLPHEIKGVTVHDKNFCCWKLESCWDVAIFTRQKTYIEHVTHEDLEEIEEPYYNIKCAGMPKRCKDLFEASMSGREIKCKTEEEKEFISIKRTLNDFKVGLKVPSKLMPKRINGGVLLTETTYEMR